MCLEPIRYSIQKHSSYLMIKWLPWPKLPCIKIPINSRQCNIYPNSLSCIHSKLSEHHPGFVLARDKTIRNLRSSPGGFAFLHRTHGSSITGVSWPFAIGWSDREEWLSFYSEKTAVPSLPLPGERGKIVRGFCLSLAGTVRCRGNTNYSRGTIPLSVSKNWLSFSHKDPDGGSEIPFLPSQSTAFTQNISWCQRMVSREELGIKLHSSCGWFFFMPSYPSKGSEPGSRSVPAHHGGADAWECAGLCPIELLPLHQGQFLYASRLVFWWLSLPHPRHPHPLVLKSIHIIVWKEPDPHRLAVL